MVLAIIALEVPLALNLRDRVDSEVRSEARAQAGVVAATVPDLLGAGRSAQLAAVARTAAASVRGRVIVVDRRGRILADSTGAARRGADYSGRPEVAAALRGRAVQDSRRSATLGQDILATAVPILRAGRPDGAVRVTQSIAAVHRAVRRNILELALLGSVVLVLGIVVALVISAQLARPIRRLDSVARRFAQGDLRARSEPEGSTEQRSLARTFNEMTERIGRLLGSQRDFVTDASHQLRTPLTGLRLRLEEARAQTSDPALAAELDAGMREVDRLAVIVEELLVLTHAGERELPGEPVDLDEAAARAVERFQKPAAERGQHVRLTSSAVPAHVWCARADLDRALDVLIENALNYSPSDTTVTVAAGPGGIAIDDEGPGFAPGEEAEVFDRFHRGSAGRGGPPGSGLGLAIALELARRWGGAVTLVNRPEGGARATLGFPSRPESRDGDFAGALPEPG